MSHDLFDAATEWSYFTHESSQAAPGLLLQGAGDVKQAKYFSSDMDLSLALKTMVRFRKSIYYSP